MKGFTYENYIAFLVALVLVLPLGYAMAQMQNIIENDQEVVLKRTGQYFTDVSNPQFTVNTYERSCKGYYTIEETDDEIIYTGYGDLANEYTYTITKPKQVATSSDDKPVDVISDPIDTTKNPSDILGEPISSSTLDL